jgi:hypothetical protein
MPVPARASQLTSNIKLDADDLNQPLVLDQNGQLIHFPVTNHVGTNNLAGGAVPAYFGYEFDSDDTLPSGVPMIPAGSVKVDKAIGPLHLDPLVKSQLDQALAQSGKALVHTGSETILVKPFSPATGTNGMAATGRTLAWLAAQASASGTGSGSTQQTPARTTPQAQTLIPSSLTKSITNNSVLKDLQHLFQIKGGKFVNWNQQTLDTLKRDLKISSPQNVAPHLTTTKSQVAAQELQVSGTSSGASGGPQPAPIPEPSTLMVFGLAIGAWAVRRTRRWS